MRVLKLFLTAITAFLTAVLLAGGVITYLTLVRENESSLAIFFLGCTGAFSVYFHIKTKELYPFADFDASLEELSKKYWALHIAFGLILSILGAFMIFLWLSDPVELLMLATSIFLFILGLWTLLDVYFLNKFIVSYKKRLERQEEISDIGNQIL